MNEQMEERITALEQRIEALEQIIQGQEENRRKALEKLNVQEKPAEGDEWKYQ
jgi:hypothetical protein